MKQGITKREREVTDVNEIKEILDKSMIVHIGMVDDGEPYIVPMNYGYTLEEGELCIYLHGATVGRKLDIIKKNPKVFFEMECDVEPFEGKVACQYGTTYASVMGLGTAEILEKAEDKIDGLTKFMKTQTGKDFTAKKRPKPMGIK